MAGFNVTPTGRFGPTDDMYVINNPNQRQKTAAIGKLLCESLKSVIIIDELGFLRENTVFTTNVSSLKCGAIDPYDLWSS
jgi:hypothetical protein